MKPDYPLWADASVYPGKDGTLEIKIRLGNDDNETVVQFDAKFLRYAIQLLEAVRDGILMENKEE